MCCNDWLKSQSKADIPSLPSRRERSKALPLRGQAFGATRVQHGENGKPQAIAAKDLYAFAGPIHHRCNRKPEFITMRSKHGADCTLPMWSPPPMKELFPRKSKRSMSGFPAH